MLSVDTGRRITDVCGLVRCFDLGVTAGSDSFAKTHECPRCRSGSCPMPPPVTHPHRPHYQQPPRHRLARTMAPANAPERLSSNSGLHAGGQGQRHLGTHLPNQMRSPHLPVPPKRLDTNSSGSLLKPAAISLYRPMIVPRTVRISSWVSNSGSAPPPDRGRPVARHDQLWSHDHAGQKAIRSERAMLLSGAWSDIRWSSSASRLIGMFRGKLDTHLRPRPVLLRQLSTYGHSRGSTTRLQPRW